MLVFKHKYIFTNWQNDIRVFVPQVKVLADDRAEWEGKAFVSEPLSPLPPMATTSCIMEDRGKPTNTNFSQTHILS